MAYRESRCTILMRLPYLSNRQICINRQKSVSLHRKVTHKNLQNMLHENEIQDILFPHCPIRNVLSRVGDKWSLLVLHALEQSTDPVRFNALQRSLPDISQKVLTTTLRTLEEDGFVVRTVYAEVPPRVDYQLTERAHSFMQACTPMLQWAISHLDDIVADRKQHRKISV